MIASFLVLSDRASLFPSHRSFSRDSRNVFEIECTYADYLRWLNRDMTFACRIPISSAHLPAIEVYDWPNRKARLHRSQIRFSIVFVEFGEISYECGVNSNRTVRASDSPVSLDANLEALHRGDTKISERYVPDPPLLRTWLILVHPRRFLRLTVSNNAHWLTSETVIGVTETVSLRILEKCMMALRDCQVQLIKGHFESDLSKWRISRRLMQKYDYIFRVSAVYRTRALFLNDIIFMQQHRRIRFEQSRMPRR